ncbi:hydroxyethylthiazole kinase [Pontiella sulfatireligans]|uniref:Hydroxyethylthiazole kinase n=1 Tax=Pontiella sulfatireligans TaxID=2750658 RepID=A0A6C2UQJ0_9BACT|nr:hydroxyethylthiazole kinase [Pontiella sulfatireligans]VGO21276.1 Hydroxyethylthiazole kinase [Pontiella sulfatireligans]
MKNILWNHILAVRTQAPLVHNITNHVVMNNTANALLAIGASPIMAHAREEIDEMVALCQVLVVNIGTLDDVWVDAMLQAARRAQTLNKPWVLDPVGAGATAYRDQVLSQLIALHPTAIRGNASEIMALAKANQSQTKGVDSTAQSQEALAAAQTLHKLTGAVIGISGETDFIVSDQPVVQIHNGTPLMTRVTGLGCTATALIGAFLAVIKNKTEAMIAAIALLSIAGELAEKSSRGPGSLQMNLLDTLYNLTADEFKNTLRIES